MTDTIIQTPPRIIITSDAFSDTYIGAKADLIAAGHAEPGMFPDLPKRVRESKTGDRWHVSRIKGGRFRVIRYFDMPEALRRAGWTDSAYPPARPPRRRPYLRLVGSD